MHTFYPNGSEANIVPGIQYGFHSFDREILGKIHACFRIKKP